MQDVRGSRTRLWPAQSGFVLEGIPLYLNQDLKRHAKGCEEKWRADHKIRIARFDLEAHRFAAPLSGVSG